MLPMDLSAFGGHGASYASYSSRRSIGEIGVRPSHTRRDTAHASRITAALGVPWQPAQTTRDVDKGCSNETDRTATRNSQQQGARPKQSTSGPRGRSDSRVGAGRTADARTYRQDTRPRRPAYDDDSRSPSRHDSRRRRRSASRTTRRRSTSRKELDLVAIQVAMRETIESAINPIRDRILALEVDREAARDTDREIKAVKDKDKPRRRPKLAGGVDRAVARELKHMGLKNEDSSTSDDSDSDDNDESTGGDISPRVAAAHRHKNAAGKKIRVSGRDLTAENCADAIAPWPHHEVWKGINARGAPYDSLTLVDFVYGFMENVHNEKWKKYRTQMLKYFRDLMEDVKDRPGECSTIRNWHGIFLTLWERGTIKWSSHDGTVTPKTKS